MLRVGITGLADALANLRGMPPALEQRVIKGAVGGAAQLIVDDAAIRAPIYTGAAQEGHPPPGTLKAAIYKYRVADECTATHEAWRVTVKRGGAVDAYYGAWVEFGHYARTAKARTKRQRLDIAAGNGKLGEFFILAQPYMRPAYETQKGPALDFIRDYVAARLPDIVKA